MPNHPGPFYVHEKLAAERQRDLARRALVYKTLSAAPRSPGAGSRVRGWIAAFLRRLADRLEPNRPASRLAHPGC